MERGKRRNYEIAQWICDLLATNEFIAFTRTPKLNRSSKKLKTANRKAMDRLTLTIKEN